MRSYLIYVAPHGDGAVAIDEVMVADVAPAALFVPPSHVVHGVVAALHGVGAVDYDLVDMPFRGLQSGGYQQGEGGGAYDAVNCQPVGCLEVLHGLGGQWTEDAVVFEMQRPLYLCDHLAARALSVECHSASFSGSMSYCFCCSRRSCSSSIPVSMC